MEESISENGGEQDSVSLNESGFSDSSVTQSSENHQNNTHISKDILIDKNKDVKPQEKKTNSPEKVKFGSPGKLTLKKQNSNQSENGGMKNVKNNDISPQASSQPKSGHLGHLTQLLKQVIIFHFHNLTEMILPFVMVVFACCKPTYALRVFSSDV
jgi:hypothetical protein